MSQTPVSCNYVISNLRQTLLEAAVLEATSVCLLCVIPGARNEEDVGC